jgi:hypothetical protein
VTLSDSTATLEVSGKEVRYRGHTRSRFINRPGKIIRKSANSINSWLVEFQTEQGPEEAWVGGAYLEVVDDSPVSLAIAQLEDKLSEAKKARDEATKNVQRIEDAIRALRKVV